MSFNEFLKSTAFAAKKNSPSILSGLAITGTIATGYFSAAGAYEACEVIRLKETDHRQAGKPPLETKEKIQHTWKLYIPAALTGSATVACIIGVRQIGSKRTAALTAAYSLSDKAFHEYRERVVEKLGKNAEKDLRDEMVTEKVLALEMPKQAGIIFAPGEVLCCEAYTGRFFHCDIERLRQAENKINKIMLQSDHATLGDFYELVGLDHTDQAWDIGWNSDRLMELDFTSMLTKEERPCLAFTYNYVRPLY